MFIMSLVNMLVESLVNLLAKSLVNMLTESLVNLLNWTTAIILAKSMNFDLLTGEHVGQASGERISKITS